MRKLWSLLALCGMLCILSFSPALSALAAECVHEYTTQSYLRAPTCTEPGIERQICIHCYETKDITVPALDHDYALVFTVDKEPTCGEKGEKSRHCKRCGARTDITVLESKNHIFTTTTVPPTCTEMGYRLRKCSNCGKEMKDQFVDATGHTRGQWVVDQEATCTQTGVRSVSCTVCKAALEQKPIPRTDHRYTEQIIAPTCTDAGYTLQTCALCGEQNKTNTVKALDHSFPKHGTVTKTPTCTEKGAETLICSRCGKTKEQSIAALGHDYSTAWTTDKEATCTAQGEQSHHCTRCDKRKDVTTLPRTDHRPAAEPSTAPTCTKQGSEGGTRCTVCGKTLKAATTLPALGHDFQEGAVLTAATCTEKGSVQKVCTRCGKTETAPVPALGHEYSTEWTIDKAPTCTGKGEQSHHCKRCDKRKDVTELAETPHFDVTDPVVNATCTQKGKTAGAHCGRCGKILLAQKDIPPTGHDMQRIETKLEATCTEKGRAVMACKVCGEVEETDLPALGHSYDKEWTVDAAPTCTTKGEQSHHCIRCGKRKDVTELPRTDHTPVYEGLVEPTCTTAGHADRGYCAFCGRALSENTVLPAKGHTPKTKVTKATTKRDGKTVTVCTVCGEVLKSEEIPRVKTVKLSAKSFVFSGKKKTPTVTVKNSAKRLLKRGEDYTLAFAAGRKEIGVYTVTVKFCGNYAGSVTRKFKILPRAATELSVKAGEHQLTLTWKAVHGATGYKVYLHNAETGAYTLLGTTKKETFTLKKLLPGAVYLLSVRAFTKTSDGTLTAALSAEKAAATKPTTPVLKGSVKDGTVVLTWNSCGDCVYEVYTAEKKNGPFTLLGTTKATSFAANADPSGTVKCFKVKALVKYKGKALNATGSKPLALRF